MRFLRLLKEERRSVEALAAATDMSQPAVSQHLRTLCQAGLLSSSRSGKEVIYDVADGHVSHVVADAPAHVREALPVTGAAH